MSKVISHVRGGQMQLPPISCIRNGDSAIRRGDYSQSSHKYVAIAFPLMLAISCVGAGSQKAGIPKHSEKAAPRLVEASGTTDRQWTGILDWAEGHPECLNAKFAGEELIVSSIIRISSHKVERLDLQGVERAEGIEALDLHGSHLKNLSSISKLDSLLWLDLSSTEFDDNFQLPRPANLRFISLANTDIQNIGDLSSLPNLECAEISWTRIADVGACINDNNLKGRERRARLLMINAVSTPLATRVVLAKVKLKAGEPLSEAEDVLLDSIGFLEERGVMFNFDRNTSIICRGRDWEYRWGERKTCP